PGTSLPAGTAPSPPPGGRSRGTRDRPPSRTPTGSGRSRKGYLTDHSCVTLLTIRTIWDCLYYKFPVRSCQSSFLRLCIKMSTLSENLVKLRKEKHLTQEAISEKMGIVLRSYRRYESGEREPVASTLVKMANFHQVTLDYLVGRS